LKNRSSTITLDRETFKVAKQLAKLYNKSIADTIKELIKKEKNISGYKISMGVRKISGVLKTDYDYKDLRDRCVAEKAVKYESID
jgi:predicted CopG family antitoxin